MKTKRLITVCVFTLFVALGVATYALRKREPIYQGKTLSEWLVEASTGTWPRQGSVPADEAIRQIGTNAFPMISQLLRFRDSALKLKLIRVFYKQSFLQIHITTQYDRQMQAIAACYALGTVAKPLVPEVAKALKHLDVQPFAEQWFKELGPDAEAAIPVMVEILRDQKNSARFMAAQSLAHIAIHRPEEVLPVLNECLHDTNNLVRFQAGLALKILGHEADTEAMVKPGVQ